jgi:hypothetical protein
VVAGVIAVIAVAGIAVVATGGSDDTDTAAPADESTESADGSAGDANADADAGIGEAGASDPEAGDDAGAGDAEAGEQGTGGGADGAGPSASGDSPVEVAEEFFAAVADANCAEVVGLMTPESYDRDGATAAEAIAECENDPAGTAMISAADWDDIELVSQDGERATIAVTITVDDRNTVEQIPMRRVDGEWKVDLDPTRTSTDG